MNTKKMCEIAMLTALYVVLSYFMKFTLIGNIQIDLGYIAFGLGCCAFGVWGAFVGVIGCAIESILFSAYGFSISWVLANATIGIICGLVFNKTESLIIRNITVILSAAVGMLIVKTVVECTLYGIPFQVKIVKNVVAFVADSIPMMVGVSVWKPFFMIER